MAQDKGYPPLIDRATVRITVQRNLNAPKFEKSVYNITITENKPVNSEVLTVKATDADNVSYYDYQWDKLPNAVWKGHVEDKLRFQYCARFHTTLNIFTS